MFLPERADGGTMGFMEFLTIGLLVCFFALMIGVGVFTRSRATDVNGFVLGGRSVGPWMTAFA